MRGQRFPTIFQPLSYARPTSTYVGAPTEEIDQLGSVLDTRYRENELLADKLLSTANNLPVRDVNKPAIQGAIGTVKGGLSEISERGDLENAGKQIRGLTQGFANDPIVKGALKDKAQYDEWMKSQKARIGAKTNGITQEQYDRALTYSNNNSKPLEYDESTGQYKNMFDGYNPAEYQDIGADMMKIIEDWKADEQPIIYTDKAGKKHEYRATPRGYLNVQTKEYVDEKEVTNALRQMVYSNPKYQDYIDEQIKFDMVDKRLGVSEGGSFVTVDDLEDLGVTEDMLKMHAEKEGWDYNKLITDPLLLEGVYKELKKHQMVQSLIEPASAKAGFEKVKNKFLTDNVLMESIKFRNRLALERLKEAGKNARQARKLAAKKKEQDYEKDRDVVTISNPGVVVNTETYDAKELVTNIKSTKDQLKSIERQLNTHQTSNPRGNYSTLQAQKKELERQLKVQQSTLGNNNKRFLETQKGTVLVDKQYKKYRYLSELANEVPMSKDAFMNEIVKRGSSLEFGTTNEGEPDFSPANRQIGMAAVELNKQTTKWARKDPDKVISKSANVLSGESRGQKSGIVHRMNKALTDRVLDNRTDYLVHGGVQLDDYITKFATDKNVDPDKLELSVAMTDGEIDGEFPYYITLTNKATGETVHQTYMYGKSGGTEERVRVGEGLMIENKPGTPLYNQGNYMAASATLPQLSKNVVGPELSVLTDNDPSSAPPVETGIIEVGGLPVKIRKRRVTFKDDDGMPLGTNTIYQLINTNASDEISGLLKNPEFETRTGEESTYFMNLDDIQVTLYNRLKGK